MELLFSVLLIVFFTSIPVVLWSYASEYLVVNSWNRFRFFAGIFSGCLTVGLLYSMRELILSGSFFLQMGIVGIFFVILIAFAFLAIRQGSLFVRGFLEKILLLHGAILGIFLFSFVGLSFILPKTLQGGVIFSLVPLIIAAAIEESSKHIAALGMNAQDYRFSKKDTIAFSFFVALGFFMVENLIYLSFLIENGITSIFYEGLSRAIFSLAIHILSASLIALFWWKALSYRLFSLKYIGNFIAGAMISIALHTLYNSLLESGSLLILLSFPIATYILLSYHLSHDDLEHMHKSQYHDTLPLEEMGKS